MIAFPSGQRGIVMKRSAICVATLAVLSISALATLAQTKSGVDKLYILNCGEGVAGDISRWSPGVNVGKSMDFVDNCYLIQHAQGWLLWDTGVTDAIAAMPDGQAPADPRADTLASAEDARQPARTARRQAGRHQISSPSRTRIRTTSAMSSCSRRRCCWCRRPNTSGRAPLGVARFKPEHPVTKLEGDHDVFGDGSVTIICDARAHARPSVAAGEAAEDRRGRAVGRCRPLQGQLGQSPRAVRQHRQGQDAGLDAAHRRRAGEGEGAALDQSRQGAARHPEDGARVTTIKAATITVSDRPTMSAIGIKRTSCGRAAIAGSAKHQRI